MRAQEFITEGAGQKPIIIYTNNRGATIDDDIKKSLPVTQISFDKLHMWESHKSMKDPKVADWVNNKLLPELEQNGILKPLLVWNNDGEFFVIDGNHRFIAYQEAGYRGRVPVQIVPDNMITVSDTVPGQQGMAENKAAGINKMFNNLGDPVYANLQRVALLAMQGRQSEAAGRLQTVIKDADPAVQKKITDAVNNIKPVTINGRVADSSTLDKSKQHNDWITNTFIPWVQSLLGQQGVAEGSGKITGKQSAIALIKQIIENPKISNIDKKLAKEMYSQLSTNEGKKWELSKGLAMVGIPGAILGAAALHNPNPSTAVTKEPSAHIQQAPKKASITQKTFQQIQPGMSYSQIVTILGKEGELTAQSNVAEFDTRMYSWKGTGMTLGGNMNIMIQNGKVISKAQFGLVDESVEQGVAENFADGKNPVKFTVTTPDGYTHSFQITLAVHGKHVGHFNFVRSADTDDVNNEAEVESRWQGQGYGKLLLMKAIDVANNHGLDFQQDIRGITDAQQNVYDSLENAGLIVTPGDGFWFLTPQGEQELNGLNENFADGKNPGRKGLSKRVGVNTKASVSSLRKTAKNSSGEKQRMSHWLANMKAGRAKAKRK